MFASILRTQEETILDREGLSPRGRTLLAEFDTWNRRTGRYAGHVRRVRRHRIALGRPTPFRILDVGTGAGGLPAALADSTLPVVLSVRRGSTLGELRALCAPLPVRVARVFPSALCTLPV